MEKSILDICTKNIEEKIGINKSDGVLGNTDYEYISFLIEEKTKVRLSISTLKRIWNDKYNRLPHISTLNALAQFLDYENWQSFKKTIANNNTKSKKVGLIRPNRKYLVLAGFAMESIFVILFSIYFLFFHHSKKDNIGKTRNVVFKSRNSVHRGLPNSVIFEYNVDNYEADSFFIQQTWKEFGKVQIYKNHYILTDLYYFPGYHMAKLIANTTIIKEVPVYIETDGWIGIINQGNSKKNLVISKEIRHNGNLTIDQNTLPYLNIDPYKEYNLSFFNVGNFSNIMVDNCQIETRIKIEHTSGSCPEIFFRISGTKSAQSFIRLTSKGCISNASVCFNDIYLDGRQNDLSDFGCDDITQWQLLSISIKEKHAEIKLNGKSILKTSYSLPIGRITGLMYRFNGTGNVDFVRIKSLDGKIIYQDEFSGL